MAKVNNSFFEELGQSPPVVALVVTAANKIAASARASAPVDSGDYQRGIRVRVVKAKNLRTVALVEATDEKSMLIESRTGNLARAIKGSKRG